MSVISRFSLNPNSVYRQVDRLDYAIEGINGADNRARPPKVRHTIAPLLFSALRLIFDIDMTFRGLLGLCCWYCLVCISFPRVYRAVRCPNNSSVSVPPPTVYFACKMTVHWPIHLKVPLILRLSEWESG